MTQAAASEHELPERTHPDGDAAPPKMPFGRRARDYVRRHPVTIPLLVLVLGVLTLGAVLALRYFASFESTDDAQIDGNVSVVGARVAGTVVAVHVQDNDRVERGAPLVDLDPADYRVALQLSEANLEQARYQRVAEAKANERIAARDLWRSRRLVEAGSLPREDLDSHQAAADARTAEVEASLAAVKAQEASVERAQLDLSYTNVSAPIGGIVGQKEVNVGDRVQPGQELLAIVQVDDLWVTANFKETQLRDMRPGQRVDVGVDALGRTFHGHVDTLPGASGARFSLFPPENATGNYVKVVQRLPVRIRLEPGQPGLDRLRPGMSVEPKVWLR
jgi:membrane fusion protein (multidrug efflux system)